MKIGILQCGHTPDPVRARHGEFSDMLARLLDGHGLKFRTWNVVDMDFPDDPADAEGWLVTGSRHGAYEDLPFIAPLEDFIRRLNDSDRPTVGVCFGHQIVAQALGGKVEKYPGGWSVGRKSYDWQGLGQVALTAWHQDQVTEPPAAARTIAGNDFTRHAALVYGDRFFTVQPHPEFSPEIASAYADARRNDDMYPPGLIAEAEASLALPMDAPTVAARMADFLKHRSAPDG